MFTVFFTFQGITTASTMLVSFGIAYQIIDQIKPYHVQEAPPSQPSPLKRIYTFPYLICFMPCRHFFSAAGSVRLKLKCQ